MFKIHFKWNFVLSILTSTADRRYGRDTTSSRGKRGDLLWLLNEHFTLPTCQRELDSTGYEMESDLVSVSSGGSMSDYGSDLEDMELELSKDKTGPSLLTRHTLETSAHRTQNKR